ncbi:hypothetical protein JQX09_17720 [Sulfitobacter pseudonitzschiae]|uniref:Uncharacterized protein n=1 Tax=Pseudosulfitobacter pseudonitzschiae TaxID=1402135 RepID=A0A9Q2RWT9_9RHOB|nr:hypothetical protein [Pseudosulfitobacter pseudonitzschiae]MBM2293769.1 hypothetical protein [Pseudosulfitobacter pseudonitzschiae]MBM2298687.1 hypothetical protein [Pseudosulfitobacter pseudonitzschiae]MBM2303601.1 hypothetical protein [Pseudosulfitobacter pseudonitzschiae]MBM2313384.1 hypothetical protein [Pseudosulfitobacter pseudonitzschiae]MBM2318297.1 hypothetical protein [Pseudosulfitobacter pseudonitzschiae]
MILNGIPASETLATFTAAQQISFLEISPVRDQSSDQDDGTDLCVTSPEDAQIWSVYGRDAAGMACLIHDIEDVTEAGPILQWLHDTTGLPVGFHSESLWIQPMKTLSLAEWLTDAIHDDLPELGSLDARADDFDNHALTPLRESLCLACGYNGDPIIHPADQ